MSKIMETVNSLIITRETETGFSAFALDLKEATSVTLNEAKNLSTLTSGVESLLWLFSLSFCKVN